MTDDTCACDMRHPDDDTPFTHHPRCVARPRTVIVDRAAPMGWRREPRDPDEMGSDPDWGTYV